MFKFLTAVLVVFCIWGVAQHRKAINTHEREIANLEYVIQSGEHCLSVCEEKYNEWGC